MFFESKHSVRQDEKDGMHEIRNTVQYWIFFLHTVLWTFDFFTLRQCILYSYISGCPWYRYSPLRIFYFGTQEVRYGSVLTVRLVSMYSLAYRYCTWKQLLLGCRISNFSMVLCGVDLLCLPNKACTTRGTGSVVCTVMTNKNEVC